MDVEPELSSGVVPFGTRLPGFFTGVTRAVGGVLASPPYLTAGWTAERRTRKNAICKMTTRKGRVERDGIDSNS